MARRNKRTSLHNLIDREVDHNDALKWDFANICDQVYQVIAKLEEDISEAQAGAHLQLTVYDIYDRIKRSNSALRRNNKKILEDSIARVLDVRKHDDENASEDNCDAAHGSAKDNLRDPAINAHDINGMNRSIADAWAMKSPKADSERLPRLSQTNDVHNTPHVTSRHANGEPTKKRRKATEAVDRTAPTHISLGDLGGIDNIIQQLPDLIVSPLLHPQIYVASGIQPPRGIILHGPPGCGKTMLANAIAAELSLPFFSLSAPSIVSGMSGESEKALREYFDEAKKAAPCIIFIDEIDAITPKRESAQREMEKRIVAQLLTCMDDLDLRKTGERPVIVLAATNRPDSLDTALRRPGRFDKEINLGVPNEVMREQILRAMTREMSIAGTVDFRNLAKRTPGFVGADLGDLVSTAGSAAIQRFLETLKAESQHMDVDDSSPDLSASLLEFRRLVKRAQEPTTLQNACVELCERDFMNALPKIQPSSRREGFATIPDTTWADIGALHPVREQLQVAIVEPIREPDIYQKVGISAPTGVLLWGPPGCGKTLLAKAVANESKANFISVKGPELLNKYVGESERAVRQVFVRARSSIPCVIFFDELDALAPRRDDTLSESSARVVNTLLTELSGLDSRVGIYVIAATNRPDMIDPAMLRPGRLETLLFVDLPSAAERVEILRTLTRHLTIEEVAIVETAHACEGFSGADLGSLLRQAGYAAIQRRDSIKRVDFTTALSKIRPSVNDKEKYHRLERQWGSGV